MTRRERIAHIENHLTPLDQSYLLAMIWELLDGHEWSADTLDSIAESLRQNDLKIDDCNEEGT